MINPSNNGVRERLNEILKENFYDEHENCDDSCGKKTDYNEVTTDLLNLIESTVDTIIGEDETILGKYAVKRNEFRAEQRANLAKLIGKRL